MFGSNTALIIAKDHVHDPMEAILNSPVTAHDGAKEMRQHNQRRYVKAGLPLDFSADFAAALDHDHGLQSGPVVAFLEPFDVFDDSGGSGLDPPVIAVDRGVLGDLG